MHRSRFEWLWRGLALLLIAVVAIAICARPSESKEIYCASQEGSADAVLLDKPSAFGTKTVAKLKVNQPLEVVDDSSNKQYIKVKTAAGVEGWIKRAASADKKQDITGEAGASTEGGKQATAAKGLNSQVENEAKKGDPKYAGLIKTIDGLEIFYNERLGGGNRVIVKEDKEHTTENAPVDAEMLRQNFQKFGVEGGILRFNP